MALRANRRLAQHFLEPVWVKKLVATIAPREGEAFLEIGSGRGALTLALAERGAIVTAVEIDVDLAAQLKTRVPSTVSIVRADFLKLNLDELLDLATPARAVGNLPYNVSPLILLKLLRFSAHGSRLRDATLMLQREVADRVTGVSGSGNWGPLAIATEMQATATRVMALPPGAFRPMPRVRSAVVNLRFRPPLVQIGDPALFDSFVRALFTQRRKTAVNALRAFASRLSHLPAEQIFARAGVDPRKRPGQLELSELAELSEVLASTPL